MLPSDELGEKGESRFKEICADARLVCNKSDRDRTGWDFLVEFPFESDSQFLDGREAPLACHIQVKTVTTGKTTIRLTLSAAERLAKELKPSFIYVLHVNSKLAVTSAHLIHISGDRLSAILKKLRKEQAAGQGDKINKKNITFTPRENEKIDPTGADFKKTVRKYCGQSLHEYVNRKKHELDSIGFDQFSYRGTLEFPPLETDEILNVFLGLRKNITVKKLATTQTRFGIELPYRTEENAVITITPQSVETCKIVLRDKARTICNFSADLFTAIIPGLSSRAAKVMFRAKMFSLTVTFGAGGNDSYTLSYDLEEIGSATLRDWEYLWRMLRLLSLGQGTIEIERKHPAKPAKLPIVKNDQIFDTRYCEGWLEYIATLKRVLEAACLAKDLEATFNELINFYEEIDLVDKIYSGRVKTLSINYTLFDAELPQFPGGQMIVTKALQLGNCVIAYYGVGEFQHSFREGKAKSTSSQFCLKQIESLESIDHFDAFIDRASRIEGTDRIFRFDLGPIEKSNLVTTILNNG